MHCVRRVRPFPPNLRPPTVGVALHYWPKLMTLDPGKDMMDVVEIIMRLLMWGWREARLGEEIRCLSYTPRGDVIATGGASASIFSWCTNRRANLAPGERWLTLCQQRGICPGGSCHRKVQRCLYNNVKVGTITNF